MKAHATAVSLALLAAIATAQDAPLVIRTSSTEIATNFHTASGSGHDLPEAGPNKHWRFVLTGPGQIQVTVADGSAGFLECTARPRPLMNMFGKELGKRRAMLQGMFVMALATVGVKTRDAVKFYRTMAKFPEQIDRAVLRIEGDPQSENGEVSLRKLFVSDGFGATLSIEGAPGTWLDRFTRGLRRSAANPPALMGDDDHFSMLWAVNHTDPSVLEPVNEFFAALFTETDEDRRERANLVTEAWAALDGTMTMAYDLGSEGYYILQGIADDAGMRKLYSSNTFQTWIEQQYQVFHKIDPRVEGVEFVPDGFEHRGIKMHKTIQQGEDGESFGIDGIARGYAVSAMGLRTEDVRSLLDRVIDGQIEQKPLDPGLLCLLQWRHFSEWDPSMQPDMEKMPDSATVSLAVDGPRLVLRLRAK